MLFAALLLHGRILTALYGPAIEQSMDEPMNFLLCEENQQGCVTFVQAKEKYLQRNWRIFRPTCRESETELPITSITTIVYRHHP